MADLILLNGPPGIGKSTLASLFVDRHPGTLNLDIDQVRRLIGGWRESFAETGEMVRPVALSMARAHLNAGRNVIMPQFLGAVAEIDAFRAVAEGAGNTFLEIVIMDTRENSVARFGERGGGSSDDWHEHVKEIVDRSGGVSMLRSLYDELADGLPKRPTASIIQSRRGAIEETYAGLIDALASRRSGGLNYVSAPSAEE